MTSTQSPSVDFNQMLVVSVFFHFFLFAAYMFLPQTQNAVKHIKPAFMVSLIDIPAGPDIQPAPQTEKTPIAPLPPATPVAKPPVPEAPAASKALVSKLDQLAKLEKKQIPKKDKTALEDFEKIKMKRAAEKKPTKKVIAKDDLTLRELEFEQLSRKSATVDTKNKPKKRSSLLKELDELEKMNKQDRAALDKSKIKQTNSTPNELVKQLEAIRKENIQIKVDTSKLSSQHSQKFKSEIRNLKMAEIQRGTAAPTASGESGDPAADALSKYVGEVYLKVFKNWKDPLGGGNGRVEVSFTIFPNGKIEMPKIVKSSGVSKLDNLAILAIKNAVPLPSFPKEFKEPNLPLTFEFTYEPSKN